jgi:transposase
MASLAAKKIRGHTYYYARECKRVNGKPKIIWQKYLGRAEDVVAALSRAAQAPGLTPPESASVTDFAAVVSLYDLALRLKLVDCIDRHVPKRGAGPSVGTYLLVATLNRCLAPCSKASMEQWFQTTALRRLLSLRPEQLSSQRFWDNMNRVDREALERIEADLVAHLVREFEVDVRRLLFDATNFFTYIDSFNQRSTLAQRGKSKEGRAALRIVGLALLVTTDFHLPLLHRTYPGNRADSPTFSSLTRELIDRCKALTGEAASVTLVFDKGNNSKENLQALATSPLHFIGSLVPTQHRELLSLPDSQFRSLDSEGLPGVRVLRTEKKIFGVSRTVLVTYNEALFEAQTQTLLREIGKRQQRLQELQQRLGAWAASPTPAGKPPTLAGAPKKIDAWLAARHMKELFEIDLTEVERLPVLRYSFKAQAWESLQRTLLGKTLLFTDLADWSDAEIVRGYRSQAHIEQAFRTLKDPRHIALRPQYHWTDQKIEVHVFCCVLALMLVSLLQRQLDRAGLRGSIPEILDELGRIHEVTLLYPSGQPGTPPTLHTTLSEMNERQRELFAALGLDRYQAP